MRILDEFYDLVFSDPVLSPYFHNTTLQRSKEKVYSFYKRLFSGEACYFGDRPRNAHHWMVISDAVFDHRLEMLTDCMRRQGLPEHLIRVWREYEEYYRSDIVKDEPRGRRVGNTTLPAGGFGYERLTEGTVCDSCDNIIEKGEEVMYHLRTGEVYCGICHPREVAGPG